MKEEKFIDVKNLQILSSSYEKVKVYDNPKSKFQQKK